MSKMAGSPMLPQKRARPDSKPTLPRLLEPEQKIYDLIESKKDMGMLAPDLKRQADLSTHIFNKALKALQAKNYIKEVASAHNKRKKLYMSKRFEPSDAVTGGAMYEDGNLDADFVDALRKLCLKHLKSRSIATLEEMWEYCRESPVLPEGCKLQQVSEIVRSMVQLKEVEELKSSGVREFVRVPAGTVCYRSLKRSSAACAVRLSSIPCLICPRIDDCTPDGVISPVTCEYYNKWLSF
ncbi:DNA-directed RNA polymerase III subunit RPC6 [Iris pallida]|uniref:DNA-directed RNA polymerase III subunit RPC6 n=1 Tax=Iris pallida TaxID=29817 RepID=A0AAX6H9X1_IRIPA|nr:DNA-directed RNA polymerase III subunit RPC6 [Iris pallida]KAJ6837633.1 DNA-directed RNA polymerase III subunit RPC6 [Iris pallida]KAJ6849373.1 DNA-directed RNA polymerase III subunit RPC6 [Iris pallida]